MLRLISSRIFRRCAGIVGILALLACSLAVAPVSAAEPLKIAYRGSQNFLNYSTRLPLKANPTRWDFALLTVEGGVRPYSVSMSNPILQINPEPNGTQFDVFAKQVGTTILTIKDSNGQSLKREVVVYDPSSLPLALGVLPSASNPVAVGQGRGFSVSGGKIPYKVVAANPAVARIDGPSQAGVWFVWGVSGGTTTITVTDAAGQKAQGSVYVGTTKPLAISADATLLPGGKGELVISSGNPPYMVTTTANLSAALKGNDSYGRTVYTLTAKTPGQGTVAVKDNKGQTASRTITVKDWVSLEFPDLTGSLRTIDVGQATKLLVKGGTAPYNISASPAAAVTIQPAGTGQYSVTGRQAGSVSITVKDGSGATRSLSLIVRNLPTLTVLAPENLLIGGSSGTLTLIGGAAPFTVTESGNRTVLRKIEEKKYQITPRALGHSTITVKDSKGTTVRKTVTVTAPPLKLELASATLEVGQSGSADIKGGVGPFTLTFSNGNAKAALYATYPTYTRYHVTGIAAGTVDITAKDSQGKTVTARVAIRSQSLRIYTSSSTLRLGATGAAAIKILSVQGGVAPYTATVSNSFLSLTRVNANQYQMVPRSAGTATITVTDSKGAKASQNITILADAVPSRLTVQLSTPALQYGQSLEARINGGIGPYYLQQISGPALVLRQTGSNVFLISSNRSGAGSAQLLFRDSRGETVRQSISIQPPGSLPLAIHLSTPSVRRGQSVQIRLNGGIAPYRVFQVSGPPLQLRQAGQDLFVATGGYLGRSGIRAVDARNQQAVAYVTVTN